MLIVYNERDIFDWVAYLVSLLFGMTNEGLQTQIGSLLGQEFEQKITPFAAKNFVEQGLKVVFILIYSVIETKQEYRAFLSAQLAYILLSFIIMAHFPFKGMRAKNKE